MAYNELTIDYKDLVKFAEKMRNLPKNAEYEVNGFLRKEGGDILKNEVMKNMPRSNRDKSKYQKAPKVHAKDSSSLDKIPYNLGIKVQTKLKPKSKDFGYLIFPDEGRGHQPRKQEFFNKSLENKGNEVAEKLLNHLEKIMKEEL